MKKKKKKIQMLVQCELCQNGLGERHINIKIQCLQFKDIKNNQTSLMLVKKRIPAHCFFFRTIFSPLNETTLCLCFYLYF